jgi:hypothetical protein
MAPQRTRRVSALIGCHTPGALLRRTLCALLAVTAILALAGPAGAATPRPLHEFFGVMSDGPMLTGAVDVPREAKRMRAAGIGQTRLAFYWREIQPAPDQPLQWAKIDALVAAFARAGVQVMPVLVRAPTWATGGDDREGAKPDAEAYARFCAAAVARYGHQGTFWRERPALPRIPIRDWQIWNEPDIDLFWVEQPGWPEGYVQILRAGSIAIRAADSRARVVAAGLTNASWYSLDRLYQAGGQGLFDVVAINVYRERPQDVVRTALHTRVMMSRYGDGRKPIFFSEVTYTSARGHITGKRLPIDVTEAGQAQRLKQLYHGMLRLRRPLGIERVYWYNWLSPPLGSRETFDYSGLRRLEPDGRVLDKPAMAAFRTVTRAARRAARAERRRARR